MTEYTLYGKVVLRDTIVEHGAVCVRDGIIIYVGECEYAPQCGEIEECEIVMPGFVDIHCHAGGATWFHDDPKACADFHLSHGTTTVCATLYRDLGFEGIMEGIGKVREAMKCCPTICGVHLEGPYLNSNLGAKTTGEEVKADREEYLPMLDSGILRHMTLAPEVPGTDELVSELVKRGIVASLGHSAASYEDVCRATALGATNVTHLFDATGASVSPTQYDGTIEVDFNAAVLLQDNMYYEIICDRAGVHVRPQMVQLVKKCVGIDRIIGVTDSCGGDGEGDDINIVDGELYGSKLTMDKVAKNFAALGFSLCEVAAVTAGNAAKLLGLYDEIGSLEVGKKADIVVLTNEFEIKKVYKS